MGNKEYAKRYYHKHKSRLLDYKRAFYVANKDAIAVQQRRYRQTVMGKRQRFDSLLRRYGLTPEDWGWMFYNQRGCCAVCEADFGSKEPNIDHDHKTGKIRGLLCQGCNLLIGHSGDSSTVLAKAVMYLELSRRSENERSTK